LSYKKRDVVTLLTTHSQPSRPSSQLGNSDCASFSISSSSASEWLGAWWKRISFL